MGSEMCIRDRVVLVPRGNIGSHAHVVVGSVLSLVVLGIVTP